jgi:hypothetical protein
MPIQRWRDDFSGCEPDDEGQWVNLAEVTQLIEDARDELFDSSISTEYADGVNDLLDLLRNKLGVEKW